MKRDNFLFVLFGLLIGFLSGYIIHEVMSSRQPPLMPFGEAAQAGMPAPGSAPPGANPAAPAQDTTGAMQQILQLKEYVAQHPEDADAVLTLGNMNFEIKRWDNAAELYEQYLKAKPGNPDVITDLGVCNRELGNFQQALDLFHQAQKLSPNHWQSRYNEVVVLAFDLNKPNDALPVLKDLERLQPDNQQVQQLAAEVRRRGNGAGANPAS